MARAACKAVIVLIVVPGVARAGIVVVDHQPHPFGGPASDTLFSGSFVPWQRVADDFVLSQPANIVEARWWGFYQENTPPASETMRIRFYGARPTDGLPDDDNILFEESFLNPTRVATGNTIFADVDVDEYFFEADLSAPAQLEADTAYWLEVVQIGDIDSTFRWEFSLADLNGHAFINPVTVDWRSTLPNLTVDTAYQLSIPEPRAIGLLLFGLLLAGRRRSRREAQP